jgi:Recombination endonuclease VII
MRQQQPKRLGAPAAFPGGWGVKRFAGVNTCGHPERKHYAKGFCHRCYCDQPWFRAKRRAYYHNNRGRYQAQGQRVKRERRREAKRYNISAAQLLEMAERQEHCCAICRHTQKRQLNVDHNHRTGRVRALLCTRCNGALGLLKENPELFEKAAAYLRHHDSV